jgi:hypothetical protein
MRVRFMSSLLAVVLALAAGCTDSTNPGDNTGTTRPPGSLNILTLAQGTPALAQDSVSFYAAWDEDREGEIDFTGGERYLRFRVRKHSLFMRPDGTLFGPGDSVLITVKPITPDSLLFEFRPAGLVFNNLIPAELKLEYAHAGKTIPGDLDGDGDADNSDDQLEGDLCIWRQENPGDPYTCLSSLLEVEIDEINGDIPGFSRFALAY